jgi:hypothetical protein
MCGLALDCTAGSPQRTVELGLDIERKKGYTLLR